MSVLLDTASFVMQVLVPLAQSATPSPAPKPDEPSGSDSVELVKVVLGGLAVLVTAAGGVWANRASKRTDAEAPVVPVAVPTPEQERLFQQIQKSGEWLSQALQEARIELGRAREDYDRLYEKYQDSQNHRLSEREVHAAELARERAEHAKVKADLASAEARLAEKEAQVQQLTRELTDYLRRPGGQQ